MEVDAGKDFVLCVDDHCGLLFIKVNKTTIFVFSAHARFISAMPVLLLVWVFACYGPSAFYLAVADDGELESTVVSFMTHPACTSVASRGTITFLPARRTLALEKFKYAFESWQQTKAIAGGAFLQIFQCDA